MAQPPLSKWSWRQPESAIANGLLLFANCSVRIQQNLTRLARPQPVHAFAEVGHRHAVRDYRIKIEFAGFEQCVHLEPCLVHQAAVDALYLRAFENNVI